MYGLKSSRRWRSIAAYAVSLSKGDASMIPTFDHAVSAGGVTFVQCAPSSRVRQICPSSVPTQMS